MGLNPGSRKLGGHITQGGAHNGQIGLIGFLLKCGFANVSRLTGQIQGLLICLARASTPPAPSLECFILFLVVRYDDSSVFCMSGRLLAPSGGLGSSISRGCRTPMIFLLSTSEKSTPPPPESRFRDSRTFHIWQSHAPPRCH